MSAKLDRTTLCLCVALGLSVGSSAYGSSLAYDTIAKQLGWVRTPANHCGGYYLENPFPRSLLPEDSEAVGVTSNGGFLAQHSTSVLEGHVGLAGK